MYNSVCCSELSTLSIGIEADAAGVRHLSPIPKHSGTGLGLLPVPGMVPAQAFFPVTGLTGCRIVRHYSILYNCRWLSQNAASLGWFSEAQQGATQLSMSNEAQQGAAQVSRVQRRSVGCSVAQKVQCSSEGCSVGQQCAMQLRRLSVAQEAPRSSEGCSVDQYMTFFLTCLFYINRTICNNTGNFVSTSQTYI